MDTHTFFELLWQDYITITPQANAIQQLLLQTNSKVINDHVAFRTFGDTPIDCQSLQPLLVAMGYQLQDSYPFADKHLQASSYIHADSTVPKIFLSELERHKLSPAAQMILSRYCDQIPRPILTPAVFWSGRHWAMPTLNDYLTLQAESDYAAWLVVAGLRANHFTVNINQLESTDSLGEVLNCVEDAGFAINEAGGRIKGTPDCLLEQGATMADTLEVEFTNGEKHRVATGFYEFARRYQDANGVLYQGFVPANADKIFESTALK